MKTTPRPTAEEIEFIRERYAENHLMVRQLLAEIAALRAELASARALKGGTVMSYAEYRTVLRRPGTLDKGSKK